ALAATATVNVTVQPVKDAPSAANDTFSVLEDSVETVLDVLANDTDIDGDALTLVTVTQATNGVVTFDGNIVRYTPVANYHGPDSFTYTVSDGALTATANVALVVEPVNDAPVASDDLFIVDENSVENVLDVLANDTDVDGDALTITLVGSASHGVVTFDGVVVRYTPNAGYSGADAFAYTVSDGSLSDSATVELTVRNRNDAPVANDDSFTVLEDSVENVLDMLANDTDIDGDSLSITAAGPASHGVVTFDGAVVRYTPAANYNGPDSFSYTVSDGALTASATANLTVQPANDAPVASDDAFAVLEDSVENSLAVLANDLDVDGDALAITAAGPASHGVVTFDGNVARYTPAPNYYGPDSFSYTVSDGALSDTAIVNITVQPVNDRPVVTDDTFLVAEDSVNNLLDVLANDLDVDGDTLSITGVGLASHGAVTVDGAVVRYTPAANYNGPDSFSYTVSDGALEAAATVHITVQAVNDAPNAADDVFTVVEDSADNLLDVLANDTDIDGDALSLVSVGQAGHGTAVIAGTTIVYTPAPDFYGIDTFPYGISDGHGGLATAVVTLTVSAVNDPPTLLDDEVFTELNTPVAIHVLANDHDVEGDPLTVTAISQPLHGTAVLHPDFSVTYTPNLDFVGTDSFSYTVTDGNGGLSTATVVISVKVPPVVYCSLYPIALYKGTLEGVNPGSYVDNILNGTQPGNFGWLTWSGNGNVPTLVNNLTPPGNSDTYVNPNQPGDHLVSINDWIRGVPGVKNAREVRNALDRLLGIEIVVPVWDATQGQGKNTTYQVFAFARVRLTAYELSSPSRISAQFLSMTYCGETDIVADSRNAPETPGEPVDPKTGLFLPLVTTGHGVAAAGAADAR
ncbi:MAG: tandem-95 repeat protein, partial [Caldilineaceae bacterium]|nr:tandem-95 repeat protein [Caldilineaceae bacterium]